MLCATSCNPRSISWCNLHCVISSRWVWSSLEKSKKTRFFSIFFELWATFFSDTPHFSCRNFCELKNFFPSQTRWKSTKFFFLRLSQKLTKLWTSLGGGKGLPPDPPGNSNSSRAKAYLRCIRIVLQHDRYTSYVCVTMLNFFSNYAWVLYVISHFVHFRHKMPTFCSKSLKNATFSKLNCFFDEMMHFIKKMGLLRFRYYQKEHIFDNCFFFTITPSSGHFSKTTHNIFHFFFLTAGLETITPWKKNKHLAE